MLDALAKSIRTSIRVGGCARLQEPFLKSVCTIADKGVAFDSLLDDFCEQYGFAVRRETPALFVFTLP
jgi:hypothetical protein